MDSMEFVTQAPSPIPPTDSPHQTIDEPFTHIGRPKDFNEFVVEPEDDEVDMTITRELRQATKEVHKLSDVLVNAKFALGKRFY